MASDFLIIMEIRCVLSSVLHLYFFFVFYLNLISRFFFFFFFFQAEDGIRDLYVTGVQTCALPISGRPGKGEVGRLERRGERRLAAGMAGDPRLQRQGPRQVDRRAPAPPRQRTIHAGDVPRPRRRHMKEIGRASCREREEGAGGGGE